MQSRVHLHQLDDPLVLLFGAQPAQKIEQAFRRLALVLAHLGRDDPLALHRSEPQLGPQHAVAITRSGLGILFHQHQQFLGLRSRQGRARAQMCHRLQRQTVATSGHVPHRLGSHGL